MIERAVGDDEQTLIFDDRSGGRERRLIERVGGGGKLCGVAAACDAAAAAETALVRETARGQFRNRAARGDRNDLIAQVCDLFVEYVAGGQLIECDARVRHSPKVRLICAETVLKQRSVGVQDL